MGRHDKRARLSALRPVIRTVARDGLGHRPAPVEMSALVALVDEALAKTPPAGRSAAAVELLARLQDRSQASLPAAGNLACRPGCVWCCDLYVSAPAPWIFAIAGHIRRTAADLPAEIARLTAAAAAIRGHGPDQRKADRIFCPFLVDRMCGIYPLRPAGCRGHCSLSLAACEAGFRGETEDIPIPGEIPVLRGGYEQALSATLRAWHLPADNYELSHAVLVALADPQAESRWFDGEDVFAGVMTDEDIDPATPEAAEAEAAFHETLWAVAHGEPAAGRFATSFPGWAR